MSSTSSRPTVASSRTNLSVSMASSCKASSGKRLQLTRIHCTFLLIFMIYNVSIFFSFMERVTVKLKSVCLTGGRLEMQSWITRFETCWKTRGAASCWKVETEAYALDASASELTLKVHSNSCQFHASFTRCSRAGRPCTSPPTSTTPRTSWRAVKQSRRPSSTSNCSENPSIATG